MTIGMGGKEGMGYTGGDDGDEPESGGDKRSESIEEDRYQERARERVEGEKKMDRGRWQIEG